MPMFPKKINSQSQPFLCELFFGGKLLAEFKLATEKVKEMRQDDNKQKDDYLINRLSGHCWY